MSTQHRLQGGAFACVAGALFLAVTALSGGCGGSNDQLTGTGGTNGGGSTAGTNPNCTGGNSGDMIVATTCAISGCHGGSASTITVLGAGLDLTVNSTIASRLVGVKSAGKGNSVCGGSSDPYLVAGSNPAKGLLIEKIGANPPCGIQMPSGSSLTSSQQQCIAQWATTLTTQ